MQPNPYIYPYFPPPPRPNPMRRAVQLGVVWGLVVAILLLGIVGGVLAYTHWTAIGERFGPICTLGISGTAATMSVQGWSANTVCDEVLNSAQNKTSATFYRYQGAPQGDILCQFTYQGMLYTVRDSGLLDLVGNQVCTNLKPYIINGGQ